MNIPNPALASAYFAEHIVDDIEHVLDADSTPLLSRRDVPRELLKPATSACLLRMTFEEWGLMAILWITVAVTPRWIYPALALLLAGRLHALGIILHDAAHMPLRRKTIGIRIVEVFCGYPVASTLNAMRYHHLRHHRDSGMPTDPYYKNGTQNLRWWTANLLRGIILVPFWSVRAVVGTLASFLPSLRNVYGHIFLQDRSSEDLRESREVIECARAEWGQLLFQSLVITATIAFPGPLLWGYLVPATIAGFLSARRVLIEHIYERTADRRIDTIIATTNDHHLGLAGLLALAPRNAGYHIVHHIHPQAALGALPRLRDWYVEEYPEMYPSR